MSPALQDGTVVAPLLNTWSRVAARLPGQITADPLSLLTGGGVQGAEALTQVFAEAIKDRELVRGELGGGGIGGGVPNWQDCADNMCRSQAYDPPARI